MRMLALTGILLLAPAAHAGEVLVSVLDPDPSAPQTIVYQAVASEFPVSESPIRHIQLLTLSTTGSSADRSITFMAQGVHAIDCNRGAIAPIDAVIYDVKGWGLYRLAQSDPGDFPVLREVAIETGEHAWRTWEGLLATPLQHVACAPDVKKAVTEFPDSLTYLSLDAFLDYLPHLEEEGLWQGNDYFGTGNR